MFFDLTRVHKTIRSHGMKIGEVDFDTSEGYRKIGFVLHSKDDVPMVEVLAGTYLDREKGTCVWVMVEFYSDIYNTDATSKVKVYDKEFHNVPAPEPLLYDLINEQTLRAVKSIPAATWKRARQEWRANT